MAEYKQTVLAQHTRRDIHDHWRFQCHDMIFRGGVPEVRKNVTKVIPTLSVLLG